MGRLILLILLGILIFLILNGFFRSSAKRNAKDPKGKAVEQMVTCAHCGVHLPESESLASDGKHFCSEEHRRLAR